MQYTQYTRAAHRILPCRYINLGKWFCRIIVWALISYSLVQTSWKGNGKSWEFPIKKTVGKKPNFCCWYAGRRPFEKCWTLDFLANMLSDCVYIQPEMLTFRSGKLQTDFWVLSNQGYTSTWNIFFFLFSMHFA